ncbi:metal cation transporting p-type ATPase CtpH domain protein [Mycobacterium kansasii]|uniref:Metal cation transporting P-type ATPase CtpH domain protein n=1 Tax=Mycobacterium kansasii TaxID=1768 RepID=A0A1V3WRX5_MYCKA|nr:metal cation transporting p-type ATPase CtpH domain protein [Mycobacterium kansasii]
MARFTGLPRRASTVGLVALVAAQLGQTLLDSHDWLVVLTALGSLAAMGTLISIPLVSQLLGCTPLGPVGWAQGLGSAAAATAAMAVLNRILDSTDAEPDPSDPSAPERSTPPAPGEGRLPLHDLHEPHTPQQRIKLPQRHAQHRGNRRNQRIGQGVGRRHTLDGDPTTLLGGKPFVTERQMMVEKKARRGTSQREAVKKIREGETFVVNLPLVGQLEVPRPEQLAYYGGLAALAALELIDWPVALVIATGHVLASNHHNRLLEELGEAMEEA